MDQQTESPLKHLEPNVAAAFSYLLGPLSGIVFFMLEKENKFIKFHSFQSILFGVAAYVIMKITAMLRIVLIGTLLEPLVSMILFIAWIWLMWKAYNNEEFELPYLGKIAKDQVYK